MSDDLHFQSRTITDECAEHDEGTSRREFLSRVGIGGLSLALAGAVGFGGMAGANHAAADPPTASGVDPIWLGNEINRLVLQAHPGVDWTWSQKCQQAQYYACWAVTGTESGIQPYGSAQAAYSSSQIVSGDPAAAPPGSFSYWTYSDLGHVVTNIGNGYCINTSSQVPATSWTHDFGHGLYISAIAAEPLPYLGWSYTNGANAQLSVAAYAGG